MTHRSHDLQTVRVPVGDLVPYPGNSRHGDVGAVCQSLEAHGQFRPLVVQRTTMQVLAGNHTLEAARQLGWAEVAVHLLDVDDEQARRINLVDNRTSDLATNDDEALAELLQSLVDTDAGLEGTGFDGDDLDQLMADLDNVERLPDAERPGDDTAPGDPPEDPRTKPGDVWVLGNHRLICGDSTDPLVVDRVLGSGLADMVFTDPPYGVEFRSNMRTATPKFDPIANDDKVLDVAGALAGRIADGGAVYLCTRWDVYAPWLEQVGTFATVKDVVVWDKPGGGMGDLAGAFAPSHEWIIFGHVGRHELRGKREPNVWRISKDAAGSYEHPTQKPSALPEYAISKSSDAGGVVLDLFGGSGSTLIGAENIGRRARLVELDPRYCDVIVDRWERHTGRAAVLEGEDDGEA